MVDLRAKLLAAALDVAALEREGDVAAALLAQPVPRPPGDVGEVCRWARVLCCLLDDAAAALGADAWDGDD